MGICRAGYCGGCSSWNRSTSNRPRSVSRSEGITGSAIKDRVMKGSTWGGMPMERALARIAAEKGGDKLVQEAEKQAANLEAEAERQIEKLTSKKE